MHANKHGVQKQALSPTTSQPRNIGGEILAPQCAAPYNDSANLHHAEAKTERGRKKTKRDIPAAHT